MMEGWGCGVVCEIDWELRVGDRWRKLLSATGVTD